MYMYREALRTNFLSYDSCWMHEKKQEEKKPKAEGWVALFLHGL